MCGRFALIAPGELVAETFDLTEVPVLAPRYNIAPTQPVAVVRLHPGTGERELTHVHWGLIPSWAKDPSMGSRMINARAETVAEKPAYRSAFRYRRCLVPASGFYEWQKQNGGKQPFYIHPVQEEVVALAGLWEHWQSADGSEIESCTILTTKPNERVGQLHNRMPVILQREDFGVWLNSDGSHTDQLHHLLHPAPESLLDAHPVTRYVNRPTNEGPECLEALVS